MRDDDYDDRDLDDSPPRRRRPSGGGGSSTLIVIIVVGVAGFVVLVIGAILIGLLLPAVQKVRSAADRVKTQNNLHIIGMAIHNYADRNGKLPRPYLLTKDGKPGLSWRVAILPFLPDPQAQALHARFKLDEPWDSPANSALLAQMPAVFGEQPGDTATHFRVFVGGGAAFEPDRAVTFTSFTDGTANTVLVVEAADAVPWTKPEELPYTPNGPLPALGLPRRDVVMVLMADGSSRAVQKKAGPKSWHAAITRAGGDLVGTDW